MTKHQLMILAGMATLLGIAGCGHSDKQTSLAFSPANMDLSIKPGVDFYDYANGNWIKNTPIPGDRSRWGSFDQLQEENNVFVKGILEEAAASTNAAKGSNLQKVGDFYASGMDTTAIENAGFTPLMGDFENIDKLSKPEEIQGYISSLQTMGLRPAFNFSVVQDERNSNSMIANLSQGGLGLPDRDYYLGNDSRSKEIRAAYLKYIAKSFELTGVDSSNAKQFGQDVLNIETRLAQSSMSRKERRDPIKTYNKETVTEMQKLAPGISWSAYFTALGVKNVESFIVDNPKFFTELGKMIKNIPVDSWKIYLKWNVLNRYSPYLSSKFEANNFDFYGKQLSGQEVNRPRWQRVSATADRAIGEAIGELYVKKYFPAEAKAKMIDLVNNLKESYKERIKQLPWMSEPTKEKALEKLAKINVKVGYPDKWQDYSALNITRDSYLQNVKNASAFHFQDNLSELGKPVDRTKWEMTPQTVNAYYSPTMNEIVFPAAILRPPFFDLKADDALNYGGIGCVIGHEMTHGFDDQGRLYDKDGNLSDWWTPADAQKFKDLTQNLADDYSAFVAIDTMHLDGRLTLGENIADYGGLTISYNAFKKLVAKGNEPTIDGFTPQQRFFLSYANVWRQGIRDKELMRRIKEDVHSPAKFRVNGALFNIPEFYDAFNISPQDPLYRAPENRPMIW